MAAKRDANHAEIRDKLRGIPGVSVADTGGAGDGFPDLVVGWKGRAWLFEIKDGAKPPSKRELTPDQEKFRRDWTGPYAVVLTFADCLREMGLAR